MAHITSTLPYLWEAGKVIDLDTEHIYIRTFDVPCRKETFVPVKEMAKKLGVSSQTILNRIRSNTYKAYQLFGITVVKLQDEESKRKIF